MYVVDTNGNIIIGSRANTRMPHPTLIGGENPQVLGAGMIEFRSGRIYMINNDSGHFQPTPDTLGAVQEAFGQLPDSLFAPNWEYRFSDYGQ
jgi:hypothetical protein